MADYWKSQPKKFCDFCKCWIADNRPSVDFHEKGKRHKENVEKRLKEMTKQSCKDHKSNLKVEDQMKKMEEAAMRAYMKDVEENRDLSSLLIKEELTKRDQVVVKCENEASTSVVEDTQREDTKVAVKEENAILWQEALSDEGHVYYWHVENGEAIWEAPADGFISIAQQREIEEKKRTEIESKQKEELKARADEERARIAREKMKKRAVKKEEKKIVPFDPVEMGPAPRKDPYGAWKAVEKWTSEPVDYQLPRSNHETVRIATISNVEPKIKFKEKTLSCVKREGDDKSATDFKKRKGNSNVNRNTRQRLDEDD